MNHKLHNTILASAVVGAALLCGLLLAEPAGDHARVAGVHHEAVQARPGGSLISGELRNDLSREVERRTRRLETDLAAAGSASEALTMASALLASSIVEATLAKALDDIGHGPLPIPRPHAPPAAATGQAQHERAARTHNAMAMPYFSTARVGHHGHGE